ncbi:MAG TPA: polymer-forming cytoskeletal protein [Thermomicrobiales bacterium]|nr:polymer-forming cytoskeletal protein [Thermomicrobiales bacterium]
MRLRLSTMLASPDSDIVLVGGARPALFSHDDDQYTDVPLTDNPTGDDQDDASWQTSTPSWRSRLAAADQEASARGGHVSQRRGTSTISSGTSISGTLRSEDPLYIEGTFDGEIYASGDVTIAVGANVNARVQAIRMTVAGTFTGSVACTDRFEALDSGVIEARIFAPTLIVHEGAVINGEFRMRIEDAELLDDEETEEVEAKD